MPGFWVRPLWYLAADSQAYATQSIKGAFPPPQLPSSLLHSLQARAARVRWKENLRPGPYFSMVHGQAILHTEGMGAVDWGAMVPETACLWATASALQPVRAPPTCHRLLRTVPSFTTRHAHSREMWWAMLDHVKDWMTAPGTRCRRGPVVERLTAPRPSVCHSLHRGK